MLSLRKFLNGLSCLFSRPTPHPLHVQWFITSKCNYKCKYCGVWRQPPTRELGLEEVKRGLDILQELKVVELVFTGGNPLLRSDLAEILKYACERFPLVSVYDNGSLAWRRVEDLKYADVVCVSLNTLNPSLQDWMNGVKGAFQSAMKSIEALKARGVNVAVDVTVSRLNINEVPSIIEFFGSRDISVILSLYTDFSQPEGLITIGYHEPSAALEDREALLSFLSQIRSLKKAYPVHFDDEALQVLQRYFEGCLNGWKCKALSSFFVVDQLGRVSGCHLMPPAASLQSLPEAWKSEAFRELRGKYAGCKGCLYLCYLAYSLLDSPGKLAAYSLRYEAYRVRRLLGRKPKITNAFLG